MTGNNLAVTERASTSLATPSQLNQDQIELLKRTVCKDATKDEMALFVGQCNRTGLDPFSRQIHFVKRSGKITIQTGIDGYRLIAERTGKYAGNSAPVFDGVGTLPNGKKHPMIAVVKVKRLVDGLERCFVGQALWEEYFPGHSNEGFMWAKMPHNQLAKCAEAQALRKAFPQDLSGVYVDSEMDQASTPTDHGKAQSRRCDPGEVRTIKELIEDLKITQEKLQAELAKKGFGYLEELTETAAHAWISRLRELKAQRMPEPKAADESSPDLEADEPGSDATPDNLFRSDAPSQANPSEPTPKELLDFWEADFELADGKRDYAKLRDAIEANHVKRGHGQAAPFSAAMETRLAKLLTLVREKEKGR